MCFSEFECLKIAQFFGLVFPKEQRFWSRKIKGFYNVYIYIYFTYIIMCIYLYWMLFYLFFWLSLNPQWIKSFSLHLPKKFKARHFGGTMAMTAISCHFSLEMTPFAACKGNGKLWLVLGVIFQHTCLFFGKSEKHPASWRIIPRR